MNIFVDRGTKLVDPGTNFQSDLWGKFTVYFKFKLTTRVRCNDQCYSPMSLILAITYGYSVNPNKLAKLN